MKKKTKQKSLLVVTLRVIVLLLRFLLMFSVLPIILKTILDR